MRVIEYIPSFVVAALGAAILGAYYGADSEDRKRRRRVESLESDLAAAIIHSQPTWPQIVGIARTQELNATDADRCIRRLHAELLIGRSVELQPHRGLLEDYILERKRAEPFEGLPNELRVHLERIKDAVKGDGHLLDPLTAQIRELVSVYERDKRLQRRYTTWGFFLAVIGTIFAAYAYFYPYSK